MFNALTLMLISLSYMFSISKHPMSMGLIILLQTMNICVVSRLLINSSWIPLTMFLVMVGGLMIIFLYMTSICSNETFQKIKVNELINIMLIWTLMFILNPKIIQASSQMIKLDLMNKEFFKFFMPMNMQTSLFSFLYLVLMLFTVVHMMNMNSGPLRKKY